MRGIYIFEDLRHQLISSTSTVNNGVVSIYDEQSTVTAATAKHHSYMPRVSQRPAAVNAYCAILVAHTNDMVQARKMGAATPRVRLAQSREPRSE